MRAQIDRDSLQSVSSGAALPSRTRATALASPFSLLPAFSSSKTTRIVFRAQNNVNSLRHLQLRRYKSRDRYSAAHRVARLLLAYIENPTSLRTQESWDPRPTSDKIQSQMAIFQATSVHLPAYVYTVRPRGPSRDQRYYPKDHR